MRLWWTIKFNAMSDVQSLLVPDYNTTNIAPGSRPLEPGASIDRKTAIHTNIDIIQSILELSQQEKCWKS